MDLISTHNKPLDQRISEPVYWGKVAGLTVQELQMDKFDESIELLKSFLIPEEIMCVGLTMEEDPEGTETLLSHARHSMRDGTSIVVLEQCDDGEQRVVGVLVARVVQQVEHMRSFSRIKIARGDSYQKWLTLRCHLQKEADLFNQFGVDKYYRIYHIVVHPDHRRRGVASFLVRLAALRLTELFAGQSLCTAVAPSRVSQRLLAHQGFRPHVILPYHEWKDDSGQQLVRNTGIGNFSVALFVYLVPRRDDEGPQEIDVSPLTNPAEEFEPEPEPPKTFPGRDLETTPDLPRDCLALPPAPTTGSARARVQTEISQVSYPPYPISDVMDVISADEQNRRQEADSISKEILSLETD